MAPTGSEVGGNNLVMGVCRQGPNPDRETKTAFVKNPRRIHGGRRIDLRGTVHCSDARISSKLIGDLQTGICPGGVGLPLNL